MYNKTTKEMEEVFDFVSFYKFSGFIEIRVYTSQHITKGQYLDST